MSNNNKIIQELKNKGFPDLKFLFSHDALLSAFEVLEKLLEQEKQDFEKLLQTPKQKITFEVFEDEGLLDYYWSLLNHFQNVHNVENIRKIIDDFRPKLQDFGNYVAYHKGLFDMLTFCRDHCDLNDDQKRSLFLRIKAFVDRGIDLPKQKQERLKELNKILSELSNTFSNNIVDDEALFEYLIEDFEVIKDLPQDVLELAKSNYNEKYVGAQPCVRPDNQENVGAPLVGAQEASIKNKRGPTRGTPTEGYLFTADPTAYVAIMKYCHDQNIRKEFEAARNSYASKGKYDNRQYILDIIKFKREKALLLGYNNYAEMSLNDKMADSPEQVLELIEGISKKAKTKAQRELEELQQEYQLDEIHSYDLAYYSRKLKEEKYELDEKALKQYFEYQSVLEYLHNFVHDFFGLELKEVPAKVYDDHVKIYEVYREQELVAYYLLDPFYRKEKRGGAWADNLREKNHLFGKIPLVVNVCNFQKSDTTLLLLRDVETLFHEFGHALHEMLSQSQLSELSGFGVEWDFVELPSQILENWASDTQSLTKLAKHHETGESLPEKTIQTLEQLKTFMSGNFVIRQNEFALMDMNLYKDESPESIEQLDTKILDLVNTYGLFKRAPEYKMYTSFGHIFGGGYSAGYYSYMWAEILEADVFEEIKSQGMFDPKVGKKFLDSILGQGTRKPAGELFSDFMGRDVSNEAFMKRKGL